MKSEEKEPKAGVLVGVAKAVGKATGAVASLIGSHPDAPTSGEPARTRGKLPKKNKSRMPRRAKKAMKKHAMAGGQSRHSA